VRVFFVVGREPVVRDNRHGPVDQIMVFKVPVTISTALTLGRCPGGLNLQTSLADLGLEQFASMSRSFESLSRDKDLSFKHHRTVVSIKPIIELADGKLALGDWLCDGKRHYGDGLYKKAAKITGLKGCGRSFQSYQ